MDKTTPFYKTMIEVNNRKLMFDRCGFYEHMKDVVKSDPLEWMNKMFERFKKTDEEKWGVTMVIDEVAVYAYAGINLYADVNDQDNISLDKVKKWVRTLSFSECGQIINAVVESLVVQNKEEKPVGEPELQPVS